MSGHTETVHDIQRQSKTYGDSPRHRETVQDIQRHSDTYGDSSRHKETVQDIPIHTETVQDTERQSRTDRLLTIFHSCSSRLTGSLQPSRPNTVTCRREQSTWQPVTWLLQQGRWPHPCSCSFCFSCPTSKHRASVTTQQSGGTARRGMSLPDGKCKWQPAVSINLNKFI